MNELSLKERECKNMLASVLDMEDDHRYVQHQCDDRNKEDKDNEDADEDDNERDELSHKGGESHVAVAPTDWSHPAADQRLQNSKWDCWVAFTLNIIFLLQLHIFANWNYLDLPIGDIYQRFVLLS